MSSEKKTVELSSLVEWSKNPRQIDDVQFERLKEQLVRLGQYKATLIMKDGGYNVVIGGNMRTRAMRSLVEEGHTQFENVWVSELEVKKEKGGFVVYINGKVEGKDKEDKNKPQLFSSVDQAILEYALSDNDQVGETDQKKLGALLTGIEMPYDLYHVAIDSSVDLNYVNDLYSRDALGGGIMGGENKAEVLTVLPPESPKLKEKCTIHFDNIDEYRKFKKAIEDGRITSKHLFSLL